MKAKVDRWGSTGDFGVSVSVLKENGMTESHFLIVQDALLLKTELEQAIKDALYQTLQTKVEK